jgi:signal transduction histidine kinase
MLAAVLLSAYDVGVGNGTAKRVLALLGFWTIPAALYTVEYLYSRGLDGPLPSVWRAALLQISSWYVWALATPAVVALARKRPLVGRAWRSSLVPHVVMCLAVAACHAAVKTLMTSWLGLATRHGSLATGLETTFVFWLPASSITYAAVIGVTLAIANARTAQQRQLEAAQLANELTRAQLAALRAQIHPHFLFNTLNTVSGLVREGDKGAAVEVLATLSGLLRDVLQAPDTPEVPLREELAWLVGYVSIQRARFPGSFTVHWDVPDEALDASVPRFVLQPLVENAFRHGLVELEVGTGHLAIAATVQADGEALQLRVQDNGPGLGLDAMNGASGTGLSNTRARLELLYEGRASLTLGRSPSGGTIASVVLPFRTFPRASGSGQSDAEPKPHSGDRR